MGTCNNQQRSNNTTKAGGCRPTRKIGAMTNKGEMRANPAKKRRPLDPITVEASDENTAALGETITDLNSQAISLYKHGEFSGASSLFRKAVALCTKEPFDPLIVSENQEGRENPHQGATACDMPPPSTYIYQRMDFDEGMNVYADAIAVEVDSHPDAVQAALLFNAGQARRKLNDMEGASRWYDRAIQTLLPHGKSIGAIQTVHPTIIPILHNVGQLTYRAGKLLEAVKIYEVALRHSREICGEEDISVGFTLNCLGVICYHLSTDRSDRARQYFEGALEILRRVLGSDSFAVGTILNNLGRVHVQREEFAQALVNYEKSLQIRKCLGTDHIDFACAQFNCAQALHQQGCYDRALALYQEFLRVALKKFSRNHRDVAVVLSGIAQIYQEKKDFGKALSLYEESLAVGRAALGNCHSEVSMLLNRLANFHFDRGNFDKALEAYHEGLQIERKVLTKNHPNVIVTLSNIAEVHRQRNDYPNSIRLYGEALRLQKNYYGEFSVEVAATLNVLGLIYDLQGDTTMAINCLQEALVIRRTVLGDSHLDLSSTLIYLGTIFYRRGGISMAMQLFNESLRIRIDNHGRDHRDVSFAMYNCGLCYHIQGSYREAIKCYQETLRIEQSVLGEKHKDVSMTLFKLGEAYAANREPDKALDSFHSSLLIEQSIEEDADPATVARILNEIGNIYLSKGETQHMMENFVKASRVLKKAGLPLESLSLPGQLYGFGISCPSSASAA